MPPATATRSNSSSSSSSAHSPQQPPASDKDQQPSGPESTSARDRALPAPGDGRGVTTLDVSGDGTTVKLGALGPLVVNQDGTMSRVANWADMTGIERENTMRILGKRNQLRLAALRRAQRGADEPQG
ncbi:Uncharacterized protein TCAP_03108 [Tolypocladium capitatum]|uniref:Fungal specific transcription factor n=1 Tax=Tolypocladium capitatum TaxID=45235 RepID=A0A2K3QHH7_9HYPO|nr:Uncharacterized protein TCAP_03108 [Tolypocladium capitatum]